MNDKGKDAMETQKLKWILRTVKVAVLPAGSSLNHDKVTEVYLDDEGAGEFVAVRQDDQVVSFDRDEWRIVRMAIDEMVAEIRIEEIRE